MSFQHKTAFSAQTKLQNVLTQYMFQIQKVMENQFPSKLLMWIQSRMLQNQKWQMLRKLNISKIAPFGESVDFRKLSIRCWICSHLSLIQVLPTQDTTTKLSGQFERIRYINNISHFPRFLPTPLSILRKAKDASESSKNVFFAKIFKN